jgi:predicted transposase YbfD/YdcC
MILRASARGASVEAARLCAAGGDYVLALKGNQGRLHEDVKLFLDDPENAANMAVFQGVDSGHGRIESRMAMVSANISWLRERHAWPGLGAIGKVTGARETPGKQTTETRYYRLSAPLAPERFLYVTRAHRAIGNTLRWVLDVTMGEDDMRNRKANGPENPAILRRIALNLARTEPSKGSMRAKIKKAGGDDSFVLELIRAAAPVQKR